MLNENDSHSLRLTSCEQSLTFELDLPWPDRRLSPNARGHWAVTAKVKKDYRARCAAIALKAGVGGLVAGQDALSVHLTFLPPDHRSRDWDNILASMKSGLDGLADALGVDDSRWRLSFEVDRNTVVPGGRVLVTVSA